MDITGTFKNYNDLLTAYGLTSTDKIDQDFDNFLKTIAGKDCILEEYNPLNKTFNTVLLIDNPNNPGRTVAQELDARQQQYGNNMMVDKLETVNCNSCDEAIYCTHCGYTVKKSVRFDNEPKWTYGDLYNRSVDNNSSGNKSGTVIWNNVFADPDLIWCHLCRGYYKFKEVQDSLS